MQKHLSVLLLISIAFVCAALPVMAEEQLVIADNGSGSTNQIATTQASSTSISQQNNAEVKNAVAVNSDTGNNTVSDNDINTVDIHTGDIGVSSSVKNTLNSSVATTDQCCGAQTQGYIAGNGSNSTNALSLTSSFSGNVNVYNNATITNSITGYANTGNNIANNNSGSVSITTGNIAVSDQVINNTNASYVVIGNTNNPAPSLAILENGSNSWNSLHYTKDTALVAAVNNQANIFNNSFWELVTGGNEARGTNGDIAFATGDVVFEQSVINQANQSEVVVTCCKAEEHKSQPIIPPEKPVSPKPSENSGPNNTTNGASAGSTIENILPVTGNLYFYIALAANIAMLIFGTYLRLRSGRSPSIAVAI